MYVALSGGMLRAISMGNKNPTSQINEQNSPEFPIFWMRTISNELLIILPYFYNYFWMETVRRPVPYLGSSVVEILYHIFAR